MHINFHPDANNDSDKKLKAAKHKKERKMNQRRRTMPRKKITNENVQAEDRRTRTYHVLRDNVFIVQCNSKEKYVNERTWMNKSGHREAKREKNGKKY